MTDTRALVKLTRTSVDVPADIAPRDLASAIAELAAPLPALKHTEGALNGAASKMIEDTLRPIGAAIDPKMRPEDAKAWRKAMLLKLSNLPAETVVRAVRRAMHDPFEFFSQVETAIRKHAADITQERQVARMRLERWQRDLRRAQAPALPAPEAKPITQEEVDRLNAQMRAAGLATRWRLEDGEAVIETPPSNERRGEIGG